MRLTGSKNSAKEDKLHHLDADGVRGPWTSQCHTLRVVYFLFDWHLMNYYSHLNILTNDPKVSCYWLAALPHVVRTLLSIELASTFAITSHQTRVAYFLIHAIMIYYIYLNILNCSRRCFVITSRYLSITRSSHTLFINVAWASFARIRVLSSNAASSYSSLDGIKSAAFTEI